MDKIKSAMLKAFGMVRVYDNPPVWSISGALPFTSGKMTRQEDYPDKEAAIASSPGASVPCSRWRYSVSPRQTLLRITV